MVDEPITQHLTAQDYDDRGVRAMHAVLIELGQILGPYRGAVVVVGGAVPYLLLREADPPHVGTLDVDLDLDPERLAMVTSLSAHFLSAWKARTRCSAGWRASSFRRSIDRWRRRSALCDRRAPGPSGRRSNRKFHRHLMGSKCRRSQTTGSNTNR